jgi:hypothetical protein
MGKDAVMMLNCELQAVSDEDSDEPAHRSTGRSAFTIRFAIIKRKA